MDFEMKYVYMFKHPQKGVIYVGRTKDLYKRIHEHFYSSKDERLNDIKESRVWYTREFSAEANNMEAVLIQGLCPKYNKRGERVVHDIGLLELRQKKWKEFDVPEYFKYDSDIYMNMLLENIINLSAEYAKQNGFEV